MARKRKDWLFDAVKKDINTPSCCPKNLRFVIDYDYLSGLTEEDKAWLHMFTDYYYTGAKNVVSEGLDKKSAYNRNNARIRSVHNNATVGLLVDSKSECPSDSDNKYASVVADTTLAPDVILEQNEVEDELEYLDSLTSRKEKAAFKGYLIEKYGLVPSKKKGK